MKLNKKYLIETILEVMTAGSYEHSLLDWLEKQVIEFVKKIKGRSSNFDYKKFREIAGEFDGSQWGTVELAVSWDPHQDISANLNREKEDQKNILEENGLWWDDAYEWKSECLQQDNLPGLTGFEKKCTKAKGRWVLKPKLKQFAKDWMVKMKPYFAEGGGDLQEQNTQLNKAYLFNLINEVLREVEEDEQEPIDLLKGKIENVIPQKNWELYVQFFDLISTFEESALIEQEEATALFERLWGAVWFLKVYSTDNLDEVAELFLTHKNLPEDTKEDIHSSIYYYGGYFRDDEWTLKYVAKSLGLNLKIETIDPDNLYEISGADGDTLDKFKERLIELGEEEEHFEVYTETGGLLFGVLARPYVNFEKKIEEIFGASPSGDPMMAGGSYQTVSIKKSIDEPFDAPMVEGGQVTADIMFEWSPDHEYGMEITLIPAKLGTTPQTLLQDYYGIWVSVAQDGPNVGKLEIGIQNYEDEFANHKLIMNGPRSYGFTVEEMKEKIKEMTGINLNEIN